MLAGFILTDIERLASVLSCPQLELKDTIASYIASSSSYIQWHLIDLADDLYGDADKSDWRAYASALNDYYYGIGLQGVCNSPLFILGGHDIVPMPQVESPLMGIGGEYLYSDMVYCFNSDCCVRYEDLIAKIPRFAVGRLPLTEVWDIDSLSVYLNDCVYYAAAGMSIRGAVMTTTQSWLRASKEMMRDIPTVSLDIDYVPLNEKMIVSPDLDTQYKDMYDGYVHEMKKVDFLVCNLHGSDRDEIPFFIGEDVERSQYTVATQPSMMEKNSPYIFNTVACYGGRYIHYNLDKSMLLSAMAYGTMLYCGSCEIALGGHDKEGNSELMMKLYNIYLHKGLPAGMALLKAKQDYYRTCHNDDGDECAMFTILEFNLFGCPLLSMLPKLSADYQPTLLGHRISEKQLSYTYHPKQFVPTEQSAYLADDIHAYVRGLVDNNLSIIRQKVEKEVYQRLGLGTDKLQHVLRVSSNAQYIGYQFVYKFSPKQFSKFNMFYLVHTDNQGEITKIIHTK